MRTAMWLVSVAGVVGCGSESGFGTPKGGDDPPPLEASEGSTTDDPPENDDTPWTDTGTWTDTATDTGTDGTTVPAATCEPPVPCDRGVETALLADCVGDPALLDGSPHTTIQGALDAASAGDTVWVCPGSWSEVLVVPQDLDVSLVAVDPTVGATELVGTGSERLITAVGGRLTVDGLRLSGGVHLTAGGAIDTDGTELTLTCSVLQGNIAGDFGGAVNVAGPTVVSQSAFCDNQLGPLGDVGGALNLRAMMFDVTTLEVRQTLFARNEGDDGGAIGIGGGNDWYTDLDLIAQEVSLVDVVLVNNVAWGHGGALVHHLGPLDLTVVGGRWEGNRAVFGWSGAADFGAHDGSAWVRITGTEFVDNEASAAGGVARVSTNADSVVILEQVTMWNNDTPAPDSGALQINTGWLDCVDCDLGNGATDNTPEDVVANGQAQSFGSGATFLLAPISQPEPWAVVDDADYDGLSDDDEAVHGTDPLVWDTDGDGLSDSHEVASTSDPLVADSDGGGMNDGREFLRRCDPVDATDDVGC